MEAFKANIGTIGLSSLIGAFLGLIEAEVISNSLFEVSNVRKVLFVTFFLKNNIDVSHM